MCGKPAVPLCRPPAAGRRRERWEQGAGNLRTLPRAGRSAPMAWAAAWLAAAIAIKVLPAVLLLFLVVRKQYRLLLWTGLLTAGFFLLPVLVAGRNLPAYYGSYFETFVWPSLSRSMPNSPTHFSLQGAVGCFLPGVPFVWRKTLCSLAVLAALLSVERAAARSGDARGDIWPFCAYLLACLLLSPVVELHHFVLAAPAVSCWPSRRSSTAPGRCAACCCASARLLPVSRRPNGTKQNFCTSPPWPSCWPCCGWPPRGRCRTRVRRGGSVNNPR